MEIIITGVLVVIGLFLAHISYDCANYQPFIDEDEGES